MNLMDAWNKRDRSAGGYGEWAESGEDVFRERKLARKYRCEYCYDRGVRVEKGKAMKCEHCLGVPKEAVEELSDADVSVRLLELNIPEYYRGREFDIKVLKTDENLDMALRRDVLMDSYIHSLERVYAEILLGKKLDNSVLVMAPQGYGKNHFVYACQEELVRRGFSVNEYVDTYDLVQRVRSGDLGDVLTVDVCFIKMSTAFLSKQDTQVVKLILDKRSRRGLPTVVTSRFNMGYLSEIEPHLENNFGLRFVDKGDYSKLKGILGPYPKSYGRGN